MVRRLVPCAAGLALLGACHAQLSDTGDASSNGIQDSRFNGSGSDGPTPDAPDVLGAWSTPAPIQGANDPNLVEDDVTLNQAQTELYFAIVDAAANNTKDLYVMTRATKQDAWGPKQKLTQLDTTVTEESPRLSPDELTLYFGRNGQIMMTTRTATDQPWGAPSGVGTVNTTNYEKWLAVCGGNYFIVSRANGGQQDLYEGTLAGGAGTLVSSLSNANDSEISTFLSTDCLTTYFSRGGSLYTATRMSATDPWPAPTTVGAPIDETPGNEEDGWLSKDLHTFVFVSDKAGTKDLYITTR